MAISRRVFFCWATAILAAWLSFVSGCGAPVSRPFAATGPLNDQIWDARTQRIVSQQQLLQEASQAHYVLLGETHDNERHHAIQADVLKRLITKRSGMALAMEQFDVDHQQSLDAVFSTSELTADAIGTAGQFDRKGWNWAFYEPIISVAAQQKLPVLAINLSRTVARDIAGKGLDPENRFAQLVLNAAWNKSQDEALRREIVDGHCGKAPQNLIPRLANAQRARDALMADVLVTSAKNGAVVVLGHGHARKDIGVPAYIKHRAPNVSVLSIGLIEVSPNSTYSEDFAESDLAQRFDIVWFTPAANRENPCAGFSLPTPK